MEAPSADLSGDFEAHCGVEGQVEAQCVPVRELPVEVRRSARRRRTVSAYRRDGRLVVLMPARLSRRQEAEWVEKMVAGLEAKEARRRPGDDELMSRARQLSRRYLPGCPAPSSIRWVTNQASRWGSCTSSEATIRLSRLLIGMPAYVQDYVILHELAHLIEPGHGAQFWALLADYPHLDRARGFLDGASHAAQLGMTDD